MHPWWLNHTPCDQLWESHPAVRHKYTSMTTTTECDVLFDLSTFRAIQRLRVCVSLAKAGWTEPSPYALEPCIATYWAQVWSSSGQWQLPSTYPASLLLCTDSLWSPRNLAGWWSGLRLFRSMKSKHLKADCMQCLILIIKNYKSKCTGLDIRWPQCLHSQSRVLWPSAACLCHAVGPPVSLSFSWP